MVLATAAATSPWWFGPAVNTAGIGLIMLQNYINRNNSSLSNQAGINEPIQWRDGSVGGIDSSSSYLDQAAELPVTADISTVVPQTTVQDSITQNIKRNEGVSEDRDQIAKALTEKYISDLAADNAATAEVDVASTPPPPSPEDKEPKNNVGAKVKNLLSKLTSWPVQTGTLVAPYAFNMAKGLFSKGAEPEDEGISEAEKNANEFLAMKKAWLEKTANSPAAQAGHSDDARWGTYLGNQAWRKDHGRSYNTNLDPHLKPSSEGKRYWNVFGNEMVFDK